MTGGRIRYAHKMNASSSPESRVSLRDKFRAATREAILEAAAGLLTADGASHIRIEDIAAQAGIAVGTLYNYFEDRTALVTALLETRTRTLLEALDGVSHPAPGTEGNCHAAVRAEQTPTTQFAIELGRFIAAVANHVNANRFLLNLLIEDEQHHGLDAKVIARRKSVRGELFVRAEALMSRGIRMKALRRGDPALFATAVIGMVQGVVSRALSRGELLGADGTAEIVRLFMTGAAPATPGGGTK